VLLVICFFGLFLSAELVIEYFHNQQALLSLEHTESYSTLTLQHERIGYERMRLHEAKTFLQQKKRELQEKEDRFVSQLKSEDAKRKEKLHFREDEDVANNICEELTGGGAHSIQKTKTKVFLAIFSHSLNRERRDLFRNTVFRKKPSDSEIVVRFVISDREFLFNETIRKQVLKERDSLGDIFTFDMDPSYAQDFLLNGKRLKLFFENLYANYDFEFVVKIEDIAFVRIPALMEALEELPKRWVYWGYFVSGQRVVTDYTHPYADPHYVEVNDRYACYATSAGFGLSKDLVQFIVLSSIEFRVWGYDDAQLGTWLSPANISYVDVGATAIWRSEGCVGCSCLEVCVCFWVECSRGGCCYCYCNLITSSPDNKDFDSDRSSRKQRYVLCETL